MNVFFKHGWLAVLVLLFSGALQAAVYRCDDGSGGQLFQDRACTGVVVAGSKDAANEGEVDSGKHFLWQASAGKGSLYLLGSIHFGTDEMYPLHEVVTAAFNRATTLVVEANILEVNPLQMIQLVTEKALYRDGDTLQQHLSPTTWKRLQEVAGSLNLPVEVINQQRPWFVSMTLTSLALNGFGYSEELGIDRHFLEQAKGRKKIIELEGFEWQLSLFDRLTVDEQVAMLEETLRELADGKVFFERMLRAWKSGDAAGVQALFDEGALNDPKSERVNQIIITDRNHSMVTSLEKLANQGGIHFVVVGAGHLTGDEGIIALLKRRGYQVTQQ